MLSQFNTVPLFQALDQPWIETYVFASVFASPIFATIFVKTEGKHARSFNAD